MSKCRDNLTHVSPMPENLNAWIEEKRIECLWGKKEIWVGARFVESHGSKMKRAKADEK